MTWNFTVLVRYFFKVSIHNCLLQYKCAHMHMYFVCVLCCLYIQFIHSLHREKVGENWSLGGRRHRIFIYDFMENVCEEKYGLKGIQAKNQQWAGFCGMGTSMDKGDMKKILYALYKWKRMVSFCNMSFV